MPRVNVIIPTYNRASCLMRAVRSVLAQDFTDWDMTIVDDGSTDDTKAVVARLDEILGPRLKYIEQPQSGASKARNRGISDSSGEWVAFLDSDDIWLPQKLGMQLQAAATSDSDFVYADYFEFTDRDGAKGDGHLIPQDMTGSIYPQLLEVRCNVVTCPSVVVRRRVLDEVGGFDEGMRICVPRQDL